MRIGNAKIFVGGKFCQGGLEIKEGRIKKLLPFYTSFDLDAEGNYLIPGLVDIHTHGAVKEDFSDGNYEGIEKISRYFAKCGVTSFAATTMTLKEKSLLPAMENVKNFRRSKDGAECIGINLEGPFLSYAKRGAQAAENLHLPDAEMFHRLNDASGGKVRLVTVAPEVEGAIPFIREISDVCTVSLGHTEADYDTALRAFSEGASHITHLFNCMPPLHHRNPGLIGAAIEAGATAEVICDGLHLHPSTIRLSHQLFGKRFVCISDSLRCTGMPDGQYTLGGQPIEMKNGKATLLGTDTLAGSSTNLLAELKNLVKFGIPLEEAVHAVTYAPAKAIRMENSIGSLKKGLRADFLILSPNLDLKEVYIAGEKAV
ncbi:MAG: N-acetylglucosamine-6-phosphate deacetylase [Clostridia bacterium]|nr:N-acetylglucosamine-6-phosphate deacetylase [Clostridia bacterium]